MASAPKDISSQVARLVGVIVDAARAGALSNPFSDIRRPRGLRVLHLEALFWLRAEGLLSVNQITRRLGTTVSKTTRVVDRLEELGLVWRDRWEDDRRVVRVHLSDDGRTMAEQAERAVQARMTLLLEPLDPAERDTLLRLMERVISAQQPRLARPRQ